jgi:CheY-like chemotaxis protein
VVDDNIDTAKSQARLLALLGHQVHTAHDGRLALEEVQTFKPDIILLDLGMPGMDGYETARMVRELPEGRASLLVAITGWGQEDDRRRTEEAGFDFHFVKPVDAAVLEEVLSHVPDDDRTYERPSPAHT